MEELVEKIEAIDSAEVRELAGRIFTGGPPTLATVGPVAGVMGRERIAERFGVRINA